MNFLRVFKSGVEVLDSGDDKDSVDSESERDRIAAEMFEEDVTKLMENGFKYPACWNDNERMIALFSPFRDRAVNPEHYDAKLNFWCDMITQYCTHKTDVIFTKNEIQIAFKRENQPPKCINTVICHLLATQKIRVQSELLEAFDNGWIRWLVFNFMKRPYKWTLNKLKYTIGIYDVDAENVEYVHIALFEQFCKMLETQVLNNFVGKAINYKAFLSQVQENVKIKRETLEMCLQKLAYERKIGIDCDPNERDLCIRYIKVPSEGNRSVVVTETDKAIDNLITTKNCLIEQLESLEDEIEHQQQRVKNLLLKNKRVLAKIHLKKKHLLERRYSKRSGAVQNIDELLDNISDAQSSGEIIDAYKYGTIALQKIMKKFQLDYDRVDDIVADAHETIEMNEEIQNRIGERNITEEDRLCEIELKQMMESCLSDEESDTGTLVEDEAVDNAKVNFPVEEASSDDALLKILLGLGLGDSLMDTIELDSPKKEEDKKAPAASLAD